MPTLSTKELILHYQTFGNNQNPVIIFSNSLGTNLSMWQTQIDFFKDQFFVICYDTRGHGKSSTPHGPYSIHQLGQDVINLLDYLNVKKASFCGISMGGLTGQWLAIHYPHRFNHIVICNTATKIGSEGPWQDRASLVRNQGLGPIAATAASRWFTERFILHNKETIEQLQSEMIKGSAEGYANCCDALAKADFTNDIAKISIPLLIIAGIQDPVTTVADGLLMQDQIIGSQLYEIDASHISNIERSAEFNQCLQQFFG